MEKEIIEKEHQTLEQKYNFVENKETVGEWLKKRMSWFVLGGAAILFIFKEGMNFSRTEDDIITILSSMALTYLFTVYMSISLRSMGKKSGKDSTPFKNSLIYLGEAKTAVKEILYLLPRFCKHKNETSLEEVKMLFIEENGLSYKLWQKGYYNNKDIQETLNKNELDALKEVSDITITKLEPSILLAEHSKSKSKYQDPLYLGRDENTDSKSSGKKMLITKAVLPIITGYLAVAVALGDNLWWGGIQVGIILLIGITHYMEGEDYILGELKNRQIGKADYLVEFKNLYDNERNLFKKEEDILEELEKPEETEKIETAE